MFRGLRVRLSLLYALAAFVLVAIVGGGAYLVVARYFWNVTDLALRHKMAHEFHALNAPLPPDLVPADRDWSVVRGEVGLVPLPQPRTPVRRDDHGDDDESHEQRQPAAEYGTPAAPAAPDTGVVDAAELAAIVVLPLDASGRLLFNPNDMAWSLTPDRAALQSALANGSDLRTVVTPDGSRIRMLTYRLTRSDGPAVLQLARELSDQDQVLQQLTSGLLGLGAIGMALVGIASWWLAGRALRPAQDAWERQQRFIASASHELRTPLTLIRATAEVAMRALPPEETDQRALMSDVLTESDHMRRLVDDLLTLSRLDSGRLTLNSKAVDLPAFLATIQRQVARVGEQRGVSVELDRVCGTVLADEERLQQVLLIALDNALRHTPAGGRIILTAGSRSHDVLIQITDTGSGIAPEHLPHVFERFYRADPARGRENGNAGLGLSIAQGLVRAMGGQIGIESRPGVGTTVSVALPHARATTIRPVDHA